MRTIIGGDGKVCHGNVIDKLVRLGEEHGWLALKECQFNVGVKLDVAWLRPYDPLEDSGTLHRYQENWVIAYAIEAENRGESSKRQKGTILNLIDAPGERKVFVSWGEPTRSPGTMVRVQAALGRHPEIEHWLVEQDVDPYLPR